MRRSLARFLPASLVTLAACGERGEAREGRRPRLHRHARAERPAQSGPPHIHNVTCAQYRAMKDLDAQYATVERNLSDVMRGRSRTRIDQAMSQFRTAGHSIDVHSYDGGFPVMARGNIPKG